MSSSCQDLIESFKQCVLRSDCVVSQGLLPSQCVKTHFDELPTECKSLRTAVFECKRGMLDMRKRFRGNNPNAPKLGHDKQNLAVPPTDLEMQ